ncbi:lactoylglutathione lyase / glyoxalase I family protein [Wolffia australiana]
MALLRRPRENKTLYLRIVFFHKLEKMENTREEGASERRETKEKEREREEDNEGPVPLLGLNHVSRLCKSVEKSIDFYTKILGFVLVERPPAFESFSGAWLFNYGVGIHLVQKSEEEKRQVDAARERLDPLDNHISFQCEDMKAIVRRLKEAKVKYLKRTVDGEGSPIDQLFFNDPDGFMIEICNCENVKLKPAGPPEWIRQPPDRHTPPLQTPLD